MSACLSGQLSAINHIHLCMIITSLLKLWSLTGLHSSLCPVVSCDPHGLVQSTQFIEAESFALCIGLFHSVNPRLICIVGSKRTQSCRGWMMIQACSRTPHLFCSRSCHSKEFWWLPPLGCCKDGAMHNDIPRFISVVQLWQEFLQHKAISWWELANCFP